MPWWWWNTGDNHACLSYGTSSLPHWTNWFYRIRGWSVPLFYRSFHHDVKPIVFCHHRSWGESPSWCAFHSPIPCICFHTWYDSTWVHTRERNRSHLTSNLRRLCDRTERRTCFIVFIVSFPQCSRIQETAIFAFHRIQVRSTYIRDISFYALLPTIRYSRSPLGSQLVYEECMFGFFAVFIDLVFSFHTLFDTYARESEISWSVNFPSIMQYLATNRFQVWVPILILRPVSGLKACSSRWVSIYIYIYDKMIKPKVKKKSELEIVMELLA